MTSNETNNGGCSATNHKPALPNNNKHQQKEPSEKTKKNMESDKEGEENGGWTPHQKLNAIVYLVMMAVSIIILDREYNGVFSFWLYYIFPREATFLQQMFAEPGVTTTTSPSTIRDDL